MSTPMPSLAALDLFERLVGLEPFESYQSDFDKQALRQPVVVHQEQTTCLWHEDVDSLVINNLSKSDKKRLRSTCRAGRDAVNRTISTAKLSQRSCGCPGKVEDGSINQELEETPDPWNQWERDFPVVNLNSLASAGFKNLKSFSLSMKCQQRGGKFICRLDKYAMRVLVQAHWPRLETFKGVISDKANGVAVFKELCKANWPELKELVLSADKMRQSSQTAPLCAPFAVHKPFPKLEILQFDYIMVNSRDWEYLLEAGWKLKALKAEGMTIDPEIIKKIGRTWPLTFLRLFPRQTTPGTSTAIATLFSCGAYTELQELHVAFSFDLAAADAVKPGALPKLEKLWLPIWEQPVSTEEDGRRVAAAFSNLPGLKHLEIDRSELSVAVCRGLVTMKNTGIESLSLGQCGLTPKALTIILQSPFVSNLKELVVMNNIQLGDKGAKILAQTNMKNLNTLNVRNTGLRLAGFQALARANWPCMKKIIYWERLWSPNVLDRSPRFGFEMPQNIPSEVVDDDNDVEMEMEDVSGAQQAFEGSQGKDAATEALKAAEWWNKDVELQTEWDDAKTFHGVGGVEPDGGVQDCVVM